MGAVYFEMNICDADDFNLKLGIFSTHLDQEQDKYGAVRIEFQT